MKQEVLKKPIQVHEIEWRIQRVSNGKTIVVPYITNRCVMERFDDACGFDGWQNEFKETSAGYLCTIKCLVNNGKTGVDGYWISKTDGASKTKIEPEKGGISDSMKRCATQWGLGRDLYRYPRVFLKGDFKYIPNWAERELDKFVNHMVTKQGEGIGPVLILSER